jgi:hypothetical protein
MCFTCEQRKLHALSHATVADVLRVERLTEEQQHRAISGVGALVYDDIREEITQEVEGDTDAAWYARWAKDHQPQIEKATRKIMAVAQRISDDQTVGSLEAQDLRDAVRLIEDVAIEFKP